MTTDQGKNGETILLAEDEIIVLRSLQRILTKEGFNLVTAENGEEALNIFKEHRDQISLVVSDISMPKLCGRGLYNEIIKIAPGMKVIFLSGYPEDMIMPGGMPSHQVRFITKPVMIANLVNCIRNLLDSPP